MAAAEAEKARLRKLCPENSARYKNALAAWRRKHPAPHVASLNDVADHIDHVRKVAGIEHVGIGSDFDGFEGATDGLEDVSCYPALLAELMRRGYTCEDIQKLVGLNFLRVFREVEKVSARLSPVNPQAPTRRRLPHSTVAADGSRRTPCCLKTAPTVVAAYVLHLTADL
jgi:membrane dipeptidase